jgi:alpha-ketoglutarate-dependent taurine dioxygenase
MPSHKRRYDDAEPLGGWVRGSWNFDDVHVHLDSDKLTKLYATTKAGQPLSSDPALVNQVRLARQRLVDGEPGVLIFDGLAALPQQMWQVLFWRLCNLIGRPMPQSTSSGTLVREVSFRGGSMQDRTVRYSDSRDGGSFHNDGVPVDGQIPDYVALLCVRQALTGGALVFIDCRTILERLRALAPVAEHILARQFCFDQRRTDKPGAVVRRPILSVQRDGSVEITYLRDYVESAHAQPAVPNLSADELLALDWLDKIADDEQLHVEGELSPGDIAVSANRRLLHGRHEFVDHPNAEEQRLMLRAWLRREGQD